MLAARQWVLILLLLSSLFGATPVGPVQAMQAEAEPVMQSNSLALLAPAGCPAAGCPGGQRLSYRFAFTPTNYDATLAPNIKVCIYAPKGWDVDMVNKVGMSLSQGQITGKPYNVASDKTCADVETVSSNYDNIIEANASLDADTPTDVLDFSFRMGTAAAGNGQVLVRLFEQTAAGTWQRAANVTSSILTALALPVAPEVFVATDPATCGSVTACYTNSIEDTGTSVGIGTGLKDAADAQPSKITVLGSYTIQNQTVHIANQLTLTGRNNATITFNGPVSCSGAMLALNAPVHVQGLNINDGNCNTPGRYLLEVNNPSASAPVIIDSNYLTHGDNAIEVKDNVGALIVQYNNIIDNSGYALFAEGSSQGGIITLLANNLNRNSLTNGAGMAVNCSGSLTGTDMVTNRRADHNYWGSGLPGDTRLTHCNINPGKVLGLPILQNIGAPGVQAQRVTVTTTQTYAFDNQISYFRTGGTGDFSLYMVNHGYLTPGGPPFTNAKGLTAPLPCSNYFDVFLPEGANPDSTLELVFKYNKTTACTAAINSSAYCNQTSSPSKYPLYWYDPSPNGLTDNWDTTGSIPDNLDVDGQTTTCNTTASEIRVSLDNSGRPNLANDLAYLPFMVGVPVLKSFVPLASTRKVTVSWSTNNEPDLSGFIVWRGTTADNLTALTDEITHTGTALLGKSYSYSDSNIPNGTTYYYRLQIMRSDGSSFFSETRSITVADATITPTATPRPTSTATPIRPTATRTFTLAPTYFPTRIPSFTLTLRPGQGTPSRTPTRGTPGALNALTLTAQALTPSGAGTPVPPSAQTLTAAAQTPGLLETVSSEAEVTLTPTPTPTLLIEAAQTASRQHPWLSLLLGLLAGMLAASAIGGAWWYLHGRHII